MLDSSVLPGVRHGGKGGNLTTITFEKGEEITSIEGKIGRYIDAGEIVSQLSIVTMKGGGTFARYGPFGTKGVTDFSINGTILGFYGKYGLFLSRIGCYII